MRPIRLKLDDELTAGNRSWVGLKNSCPLE
jgi:hypothetical protein